ncbi:MAG: CBS domain-containing protein [Solirubrobacteraceae bacterium]
MSTTVQPYHGSYLMPSLEHATVADAMHPGILSCEADAPLIEVARAMATHHVHSIAVMGISHEAEGGERLVWGIVTDHDVVKAGIDGDTLLQAGALAKHPILSVEPTTPLLEAGKLMLDHGASHVVVIDPRGQRPIGIISTLDIAGVLAWGEA